MALDTKTIERIQTLLRESRNIGGYFERHEAVTASPSVDKHGAGFELSNDRFQAFKLPISFNCHTGTYGSSSCSTDLHARTEDVAPYFVKAMNIHRKLLFETAARLMEEEAAALTSKARAEIAGLQAMVDGLSPYQSETA